MRIAVRVDASTRIGGGHALRCLALADELRDRGAETIFICAALPPELAQRITGSGHELRRIDAPEGLERSGEDWHEPPLAPAAQQADADATQAALGGSPDWIIVDHYLLDSRWHEAARRDSERILVVDDLANRRLDCDVVVDETLGRQAAEYRPLVPAQATILTGAAYALLRPEFVEQRAAAFERRRSAGPKRRVLVSLGTTDLGGVTAPVVEGILAAAPDVAVDVVLGGRARSLARVRELARAHAGVSVHVATSEMALLMREADLAVGAGGTSAWERCCLGLPSITLVLAGNQSGVAAALEQVGAAITIGDPAEAGETVARLIGDHATLETMSAAAFAVADGLGTGRVADHVTGSVRDRCGAPVQLRRAVEADSEMLWLWRNDPLMRAMAKSHDPVSWSRHSEWFTRAIANDDVFLFIAETGGDAAAMVRFDVAGDEALVSINVAPPFRGRQIGGVALREACRMFSEQRPEISLIAEIHPDNAASVRIFSEAGFRKVAGGAAELLRFVKEPVRERAPHSRRQV